MRMAIAAAVAAISMTPAVGWAQQQPATGVPPAPVGHRQPTAGDVPSGDTAAGDPNGTAAGGPAITPADRRVDKLINVCPKC